MLNLMCLDMVTRKGILLTNMMSPASVTTRYLSIIPAGMVVELVLTGTELRCTVFPFSEPTSGPKICSAAIMSSRVIGQFGNRLFSTILMNVRVLGRPIIFCIFRASTACE